MGLERKRERAVLNTVDPRLLFNADETDLNRKDGAPTIAVEAGMRVTYVTKDHTVYPFAILHGPPQVFARGFDESIVRYTHQQRDT